MPNSLPAQENRKKMPRADNHDVLWFYTVIYTANGKPGEK
jgi:hypothetical protein